MKGNQPQLRQDIERLFAPERCLPGTSPVITEMRTAQTVGKVIGNGQQTRCFCNVRDVVRAIVALSQAPGAIGEIFNIGSLDETTILDLARRIVRRADSRSEISPIPYDQAYTAGFEDIRRRVPNTAKIEGLIGWQPIIPLILAAFALHDL